MLIMFKLIMKKLIAYKFLNKILIHMILFQVVKTLLSKYGNLIPDFFIS